MFMARSVDSTSGMRMLRMAMGIAAVVAIFTMAFGRSLFVSKWLIALAPIARLIPNIAAVAAKTADPTASEITVLLQWLFAPIYIGLFFYFVSPWSRHRRGIALGGYSRQSLGHRHFTFVFGILLSGAWLLGDVGLIPFPTFFNGGFILASGMPQLRLISQSSILFALYAWSGPIVEAVILWMFFVLIFNAKIFLAYSLEPDNHP